jgi:hopanoid biosynthesis associated radical SAM protein HpnH
LSIPFVQKRRIGSYVLRQLAHGKPRFPLVLMLEPLFRCNLQCKGCGKNAHPEDILNRRLSVEECVSAAEECGAPVVSIPGGEPLLHPDIHVIVRELISRKKFIYLCTNGLLVEKRHRDFEPSPFLTFNIHLDGLRERHDEMTCRKGAFDKAVEAVRLLLSRGFRVTSNTTFFYGETPGNAARLFDFLTALGIEAMTVSSAFSYEEAADQEDFLGRNNAVALFRRVFELGRGRGWRFNHSGLYLDFLSGNRTFACSPWGTPTRNIFGWQKPCYLLNDGYAATCRELMDTVDWDRYGVGRDPRCADCMVHCGYEPSAVIHSVKNPIEALKSGLRRMRMV